jgi:hypothetical protein
VIRVALPSLAWAEVVIEGLEPPLVEPRARSLEFAHAGPATLRAGAATEWRVLVRLPDGAHVSDEAPTTVRVRRGDEVLLQKTMLGATWPLAFELPAQPPGIADLYVQVSFAYCLDGQGVCVPASPAWSIPVRFEDRGEAEAQLTASLA